MKKIKMKINMMDRLYFLIFVATAVTCVYVITPELGSGYDFHAPSVFLAVVFIPAIGTAWGFSTWLIHRVIQKRGSFALLGSRIGWYIGGYGVYPFVFFSGYVFTSALGFSYMDGGFYSTEPYIFTLFAALEAALEYAFGEGETAYMGFSILSFFMLIMAVPLTWTIISCLLVASLGYLLGGLAQRLVQRLVGQRVIAWTDWRKEHPEGGRRDWESLCPILAILWTVLVAALLALLWSM